MTSAPRTAPVGLELTWLAIRIVLAGLAITVVFPSLLALAATAGH